MERNVPWRLGVRAVCRVPSLVTCGCSPLLVGCASTGKVNPSWSSVGVVVDGTTFVTQRQDSSPTRSRQTDVRTYVRRNSYIYIVHIYSSIYIMTDLSQARLQHVCTVHFLPSFPQLHALNSHAKSSRPLLSVTFPVHMLLRLLIRPPHCFSFPPSFTPTRGASPTHAVRALQTRAYPVLSFRYNLLL